MEDKVSEQLNRIRIYFDKESIDQAFKLLDIPKTTYSNYYNKKKLPTKLVSLLRDIHFMNPEWLKTGKGSRQIVPTPSEMMRANHIEEPQSRYGSSECMVICDAIKRRDPAYTEEIVAQVLTFISSLNIPLASKKDNAEKKA